MGKGNYWQGKVLFVPFHSVSQNLGFLVERPGFEPGSSFKLMRDINALSQLSYLPAVICFFFGKQTMTANYGGNCYDGQ